MTLLILMTNVIARQKQVESMEFENKPRVLELLAEAYLMIRLQYLSKGCGANLFEAINLRMHKVRLLMSRLVIPD